MGPARFNCVTLLLMNNVLKFNYVPGCFLMNAFKNGPLILCNVPSFRNETKRKIYCSNMIRKRYHSNRFYNRFLSVAVIKLYHILHGYLPCSMFYKRCLCALFILLNEKLFFFFTSPVEPNYDDDVIEMWLNSL